MSTSTDEEQHPEVVVSLRSIGVIHTPFTEQSGTPIQSRFAREVEGVVELFEPYAQALADLDGFERIWLIFFLDRSKAWEPTVVPYLDKVDRGLFATRAPARPCPVGLTCVQLLSVSERHVTVRGVDVLDGTPLLDIKPYVPLFDAFPESRAGWLEQVSPEVTNADGRFSKDEPQ